MAKEENAFHQHCEDRASFFEEVGLYSPTQSYSVTLNDGRKALVVQKPIGSKELVQSASRYKYSLKKKGSQKYRRGLSDHLDVTQAGCAAVAGTSKNADDRSRIASTFIPKTVSNEGELLSGTGKKKTIRLFGSQSVASKN